MCFPYQLRVRDELLVCVSSRDMNRSKALAVTKEEVLLPGTRITYRLNTRCLAQVAPGLIPLIQLITAAMPCTPTTSQHARRTHQTRCAGPSIRNSR